MNCARALPCSLEEVVAMYGMGLTLWGLSFFFVEAAAEGDGKGEDGGAWTENAWAVASRRKTSTSTSGLLIDDVMLDRTREMAVRRCVASTRARHSYVFSSV
mmetsp:Transcript_39419/g.118380  ORF Transcript_39419/g.118380 Transcript_39419/m.118380 type:complete len:102 (-) Transcript_39419:232-537(-)